MTNRGKLAVLAGVLAAGLAPSFVDWKQSPELRREMIAWYGVTAILVVAGLWDGA